VLFLIALKLINIREKRFLQFMKQPRESWESDDFWNRELKDTKPLCDFRLRKIEN
jgi:hypothetical protein